ncbi:carboxypeptidase regulatory-like domain-containing protein [candidate division KSB1 bacterium]|nr:carboxypeptidase regulatory-like domain-containing protein [candidate division KSB1 bacterium]
MQLSNQKLLLLCAVLSWSCLGDMPHENPLDPQSPAFVSTGVLRGQVTTFYQPYRGIRGITLELSPGNMSTLTDTTGAFTLRNIPEGDYVLYARHKNYASDSVQVTVAQEASARLTFQLDALPKITSVIGRTFHVSNVPPEENVDFALFEARVEDPDGRADIAKVWMQIEGSARADTLRETSQAGLYDLKVFGTDFPNRSLHHLLGRRLRFMVSDRLGHQSDTEEVILFRIIDPPPETISPKERALADSTKPRLIWQPLPRTFAFSYSVRVEKIVGGIPSLVWERLAIADSLSSLRVDRALTRGEHRWTVAAVDEFGNTSTSSPAAFVVK